MPKRTRAAAGARQLRVAVDEDGRELVSLHADKRSARSKHKPTLASRQLAHEATSHPVIVLRLQAREKRQRVGARDVLAR